MAIHNQVILNGQIQEIRKYMRTETKEVVQIQIALKVMRRPQVAAGNKRGDPRTDIVQVTTRDKKIIGYLIENNVIKGDLLEVFGIFCTLRSNKHFICSNCAQKNTYEGTSSFVHPLCVRVDELNPKRTEIIKLTEAERHLSKDDIKKILLERKTLKGNILSMKELGVKDNLYLVQVIVREKMTDESVKKWLSWMSEGSNRICIVGNLCNDPSYNPIDKEGGRVCTYQVGINRKVFLRDDDPNVKADYPWVKSLGEQADKDSEALRMGSLVLIDGSIQAKHDFFVKKKCDYCGTLNEVIDSAMEIVPYSVEYLKNCISIEKEEDDYPDIPEFLDIDEDKNDILNGKENQEEQNKDDDQKKVIEDTSFEENHFSEYGFAPENREEWDEGQKSEYEFHAEDYGSGNEFDGFSSMYSEGYGDD